MHSLNQILDQLDRWHQRATYGAVAMLTGGLPQSVMSRRPHCHRDSWVVNARTKRPTRYAPEDTHPALEENAHVISSGPELAAWMLAHRGPRRVRRPAVAT